MSKLFIGLNPLNGNLYENGILKDSKLFKKSKELREGTLLKVRINLKSQVVQWYTQYIENENWSLIK
jgi:hypothetical protein